MLSLLALELIARLLFSTATTGWDYWTQTAADKNITYLRLQKQNQVPEILIVGDSSADYGFSPFVFNEVLGRPRVSYNLATLGNFPFSFDKTINDMLLSGQGPLPHYLFIVFTRGGFQKRNELRTTESSVLSSPVVRRSAGKTTIGDLLVLARIWPARMALLDWIRDPDNPTISNSRGYRARDNDSKHKIEAPQETEEFILDPERLAVLERTLQLCQLKGIRPIIIQPPIHSLDHLRWRNPDAYSEAVVTVTNRFNVPFWDYSGDTSYDEQMRDRVHLTMKGAHIFSAELARRFLSWSGATKNRN